MEHFTPGSALLGGVMIGGAAVLLMALNGRIAGISSIGAGLLGPAAAGERAWRLMFLLGLVAGAAAAVALGVPQAAPRQGMGTGTLLLAGLLVGFGTSMAGGCTSGHGVCGLSRLSPRSLAAVGVFMGVAGLTVWLVRHGVAR